jgi:hypothetical protein
VIYSGLYQTRNAEMSLLVALACCVAVSESHVARSVAWRDSQYDSHEASDARY